jgi:nicotinamide mononucleotide transporter
VQVVGALSAYLEFISVAFALAYLLLAMRQSPWCWPAALISVALATIVFFGAKLYMESLLQFFYFAMGIYGWRQWTSGGREQTGVEVHWWSPRTHSVTLLLIGLASTVFGWLLTYTDAAFPYLDSFTTVAAIVTTFMVARKVIENWIYWFAIDVILVYLYLARELYWYAGLYVLYLLLVVAGFRAWRRSFEASAPAAEEVIGDGSPG